MDKLIANIENGITRKSEFIGSIRDPKMLLNSLRSLNGMIGNGNIKNKVAAQITHLIAQKVRKDNKPVMLHSLLYGPPGTGKSKTGVYLARIWYSLGYLNGKKSETKFVGASGEESMESLQSAMLILTLIILLITILSYIASIARKCYDCVGLKWFLIGIGILAFIVISVFVLFWGGFVSDEGSNVPQYPDITGKPSTRDYLDDDDIIKIISREDLVGRYVGWTAKKTKEVLENNIGKVIFIDEAYSLVNGSHDSFGMECLDTLNRFMSENPDKIIVIMAGYKEKIKASIFEAQPGLKRRFMWSFSCSGYTPEELFEIWKQQIDPWRVQDENAARELFLLYKEAFPNQAGDTLRLANYAQIAHSGSVIEGENIAKDVLTIDHISQGIQTLMENNMDDEDDGKKEEMFKLMETFKRLTSDKSMSDFL
jgi:DNA polymerase III delta prime subunit